MERMIAPTPFLFPPSPFLFVLLGITRWLKTSKKAKTHANGEENMFSEIAIVCVQRIERDCTLKRNENDNKIYLFLSSDKKKAIFILRVHVNPTMLFYVLVKNAPSISEVEPYHHGFQFPTDLLRSKFPLSFCHISFPRIQTLFRWHPP